MLKLIRLELFSWSNTKFLYPINKEMSDSSRGELSIRYWELKG